MNDHSVYWVKPFEWKSDKILMFPKLRLRGLEQAEEFFFLPYIDLLIENMSLMLQIATRKATK